MKKVLITGGAQGLGSYIAREFNKKYEVIIAYKDSVESAKELSKELNVKNVRLDISNELDIKKFFDNNKIDVLINNASVSLDNDIMEKDKAEFMRVLEVNLVGTYLMSKEAVKNGVKDIINISSTDSVDTYQSLNIDYSSSKAGVNILTKTFALTYKNVRTIAILPNWINTDSVLSMNKDYLENELKRIGQDKLLDQKEVAKKILEIYENKNIKSGELIRIDGDMNV